MKYEERDEASALRSAHERAARDSPESQWRARAERAEAAEAALNAQLAALNMQLANMHMQVAAPPAVVLPPDGTQPQDWNGWQVGMRTRCFSSRPRDGCLGDNRVLVNDDMKKTRRGHIKILCSVCRRYARELRLD